MVGTRQQGCETAPNLRFWGSKSRSFRRALDARGGVTDVTVHRHTDTNRCFGTPLLVPGGVQVGNTTQTGQLDAGYTAGWAGGLGQGKKTALHTENGTVFAWVGVLRMQTDANGWRVRQETRGRSLMALQWC